ncbi:hypothetical protein PMIN03_009153 [Paraphaeosphaeria minitans]
MIGGGLHLHAPLTPRVVVPSSSLGEELFITTAHWMSSKPPVSTHLTAHLLNVERGAALSPSTSLLAAFVIGHGRYSSHASARITTHCCEMPAIVHWGALVSGDRGPRLTTSAPTTTNQRIAPMSRILTSLADVAWTVTCGSTATSLSPKEDGFELS